MRLTIPVAFISNSLFYSFFRLTRILFVGVPKNIHYNKWKKKSRIFSIRLFLFVIFSAVQNGKAAVDRFQQQHAHELVRKGQR